jgi:hypothetical protein
MANPIDRTGRKAPQSNGEISINLDMRSLGGEGAFGWGVLDGLLDEPSVRMEGICATGTGL